MASAVIHAQWLYPKATTGNDRLAFAFRRSKIENWGPRISSPTGGPGFRQGQHHGQGRDCQTDVEDPRAIFGAPPGVRELTSAAWWHV